MAIAEIALFHIKDDKVDEFVDLAVTYAPRFVAEAGAQSFEVWRSLDILTDVHVVIDWESVEAHTKRAPATAAFQEWVAAANPLSATAPTVYHIEKVA
jgi:quinol monooxygenase YgiN